MDRLPSSTPGEIIALAASTSQTDVRAGSFVWLDRKAVRSPVPSISTAVLDPSDE
ncbi:hypothetical protein [Nonomuraea sp. NPDC049480]|uniref:hypothetical protein n=1 Tax=Nonomuraea sp. NPDC049480 TaxID=3364353 RepID=UPI0037B24D8A